MKYQKYKNIKKNDITLIKSKIGLFNFFIFYLFYLKTAFIYVFDK